MDCEISASTPSKDKNTDEDSDEPASLQIIIPSSNIKRKHQVDSAIEKEINYIKMTRARKQKKTNADKDLTTILRYVIQNENMRAQVSKAMEAEEKITRSKARKLRNEKKEDMIWPLSPIPLEEVQPSSWVTDKDLLALINEELPEDEDDDEYMPTLDDMQDPSDDESGCQSLDQSTAGRYLENFDSRFLDDSLPEEEGQILDVQNELLFKKPADFQKPENIGQRTRSKLSYSSTPLDAIKAIPDWHDYEFKNFVKELFELPTAGTDTPDVEEDEDDDPEYVGVTDLERMDAEELRRDRAVEVPREEVRQLMDELAVVHVPMEQLTDASAIIESSTVSMPAQPTQEKAGGEIREEEVTEPAGLGLTFSQRLLLTQQMCQHVQLLTQNFIQVHCHPTFGHFAASRKVMLAELVELSRSNTIYNVFNLKKAFVVVEEWEKIMLTIVGKPLIKHMTDDMDLAIAARNKKRLHIVNFHPMVMKVLAASDVFMYPHLLPHRPFRPEPDQRSHFVDGEDKLIALGLEQFMPITKKCPRWSDGRFGDDLAASDWIHEQIMPLRSTIQIARRIRTVKGVKGNPIWHYKQFGVAPQATHYINLLPPKPPKDHNLNSLPKCWSIFLANCKDLNRGNPGVVEAPSKVARERVILRSKENDEG